MLEFEHIVQVNDLSNSAITPLTRQQLWRGLLLRARNPEKFNHGLECESQTIENNQFLRMIAAGESKFVEKVTLHPEQMIRTCTLTELDQPHAESTAQIEEPQEGYLFVRFSYRRELEVTTEAVDVAEHLKSAYVQVDRDAIALIRLLAESRLFDQSVN